MTQENTSVTVNNRYIPTRKPNKEYRSREFLHLYEVNQLIEVAECGRKFRLRNSLIVLMLFRHGLRISELVNLKWDAILWNDKEIYINRSKNGESGVHPLQEDEYEKLLKLKSDATSNYIFSGERGEQLKEQAITKLIQRLGEKADLGFPVHPHQLRHACGYHLANQGMTTRDIQVYLGHKNIQNTEKYTKIDAKERFKIIKWYC